MNDEYNRRLNAMSDKVDTAIKVAGRNDKEEFIERLKHGIANVVIYSAYSVVDELPIDNLDEVPFKGTFVVTGDYDEFWDGMGSMIAKSAGIRKEEGRAYESKPITDPTWLQLAVIANECIIATNDFHHVFFEGADKNEDTLQLFFGS